MTKRLGFKPTFKEQLRRNARASRYYSLISVGAHPPPLEPNMPGVDIDAVHKKRAAPRQLEAPVVAAIGELLAVHPRVLMALRMNSGAASYEASSGRYAPVWFHKWLRYPKKMRMPDFFGFVYVDMTVMSMYGLVTDVFVPLAIEAKAPGWKRPQGDREKEQDAFLMEMRRLGGRAGFATNVDEARRIIES